MGTRLSGDSIADVLAHAARQRPNALAILAPGQEGLTYTALYRHVSDVVGRLRASGVARNDRIAVVVPNGPEAATAFLATAAAATSAPLNPKYRSDEFTFYFSDLQPKALVVASTLDTPARDVARAHGVPIIELTPTAPAGLFSLDVPSITVTPSPDFAQSSDIALVLHTSGTTARPKQVPLTHANLCASAAHIGTTLALTESDRCLNVMPLFHIHGLVAGVLSSLAAGGSVVCTPGLEIPAFFDWLTALRATWYTAVPTMHQAVVAGALARHAPLDQASLDHALRFIRSSSASLPKRTFSELERLFGVPVIEAYGMTEAAHQMTSNPLPPRERKPGSVGLAAGPEVAIMDDAGALLPAGAMGEVVIRGPDVTSGYANNPEANAAAFTNGWFRTGDQGAMDVDGYLTLTGRLKELINRGGEKISPLEVDQVLMDHPAVAQAVTFSAPHPTLGEEVAAAVVLRKSARATERELREFVALRLTYAKVPRHVVIVDAIPTGPSGKLQRRGLAERLGIAGTESHPVAQDTTPPRTAVEEQLWGLWSVVMRFAPSGVHANFFDAGGDSIRATQFVARVRETMVADLSLLDFFDAPTIAGVSARLADHGTRDGIPRRSDPNAATPLSLAQQRLWMFDQLEPGDATYNRPKAFRLTGPIDVSALEQAFAEVLRRHEVLRSAIALVDGVPMQQVSEQVGKPLYPTDRFPLPLTDLSALPIADRSVRLRELLASEADRPFDLATGPFLRAGLMRIEPHEHVLFVTTHHIAMDGSSDDVLFRELSALYGAFAAHRPASLPRVALQYADYAAWQSTQLASGALESDLVYWRAQLAGAPVVLELPTSRSGAFVHSSAGVRVEIQVPRALADALTALGREEQATRAMTLLAAFQLLISRYTGGDDIVVGFAVAGRTRTALEGLIGCFTNTLPIRTDLSGDPTFREILRQVRRVMLEGYAHQELPIDALATTLHPEPALRHRPLVQILFNVRPMAAEWSLAGVSTETIETHTDRAGADLTVEIIDRPDGFSCVAEFATARYDEGMIRQFLAHYAALLTGVVMAPDERGTTLPLLSPDERRRILVDRNATDLAVPYDQCVHTLVAAQARRTPDAIAVADAHSQLTYAALEQRADILARDLRAHGVGPDIIVGVCLERSVDQIVTLLAILRAGGAYLPLDPSHPIDRLAFMLTDTHAPVLVVDRTTSHRVPDTAIEGPLHRITIDARYWMTAASSIPSSGPDVSSSDVNAGHLAYVIYTSGTTGRPKGVRNAHRGISNHLLWMQHAYPITPSDRVLQKTPISFDVSVWEIFWPLMAGATLVMTRPDGHIDLADLAAVVREQGITTIHFVSAMLQRFLQEPTIRECTTLRRVICSGEALSVSAVRRTHEQWPDVSVLNLYGPTEAAVHASHWLCERDTARSTMPIGRPIGNVQLYVLDKNGEPVPDGVAGELYIGGVAVALGYLNRPDLTAERFVLDPFRPSAAGRLYRTGDRARYDGDGVIEYLGRADDQVKMDGVRIELGEIESALAEHASVRECAVVLRGGEGNRQLVAYVVPQVVPHAEVHPSDTSLRSHLMERLPAAMVPATFVVLAELPTTRSGKVDRGALPAPSADHRAAREAYVRPETPTESIIADTFASVLKGEHVGIRDNFFELGGQSLSAIRIIAQLRTALGVEISVRSLFEHPTPEALAALMHAEQRPPESPVVPVHVGASDRPPLFFLHGDYNGGGLYTRTLAQHLPPEQSMYAIYPHQPDGPSSVEAMASDFLTLIRQIQSRGPYCLGGYCNGGLVAFEMARRLQVDGEVVGALVLVDTIAPTTALTAWYPWYRRLARAIRMTPQFETALLLRLLRLRRGRWRKRVVEEAIEVSHVPADWEQRRDRLLFYQRAINQYVPGAYPGRVTVVFPEDDPAWRLAGTNPTGGWDRVSAALDLHTVPGDHVTMLTSHAETLGAILRDRLAVAVASSITDRVR